MIKKILTIAGSDCSGGAGIQADIKTMTVHKMYAMSVVTALTAQNTVGVKSILEADSKFVEEQIDCIFEDIKPDAIKIGMVSNSDIISTIAKKLLKYNAKNIVIDPVMVATSGGKLLNDDAIETLKDKLIPIGNVITPNIPEAEIISGIEIKNREDMIAAAKIIGDKIKGAVLIKGGHAVNDANDLLYDNGEYKWFNAKKIDTKNTHGTGCTLSSAIACNLADGKNIKESVCGAKEYLHGAIKNDINLGKGSGPLNHIYKL